MHRDRSCIADCRRIPRVHDEPQRSCAAVKRLISLFCQTSESIISYTNGLNYDQMSWVTCCHGTPCESCFIRSQHVLRSAKPCLLLHLKAQPGQGLRVPFWSWDHLSYSIVLPEDYLSIYSQENKKHQHNTFSDIFCCCIFTHCLTAHMWMRCSLP